jgi:hypothetical protein
VKMSLGVRLWNHGMNLGFVKWLTMNHSARARWIMNKAVQDYDSYSVCIDYFEIL